MSYSAGDAKLAEAMAACGRLLQMMSAHKDAGACSARDARRRAAGARAPAAAAAAARTRACPPTASRRARRHSPQAPSSSPSTT